MTSLICGIYIMEQMTLSKKKKKPKPKKQKQITQKIETNHDQGEQGSQGEKGRECDGWAFWGFFGCKLVYTEWMENGTLLYRTVKCVMGHFAVPQNLM